jgi:hypothetical protein
VATVSAREGEALVRRIAGSVRRDPEPSSGRRSNTNLLLDLAGAQEAPLSEEARDALNRLCRTVAVSGRLAAFSSVTGKRLRGSPPLGDDARALLVALLLDQASHLGAGEVDRRGWALKCLNAALGVLASDGELPEREALSAHAEALLGRLDRT